MAPKRNQRFLTGQGNKIMGNNDFLPRNEYEMCGFFEDLLFMKIEKFSPELGSESEKLKLRLTDKDTTLLDKTGILRKWCQL